MQYDWVEIGNGMAIRCEYNGTGYDVILRTNQTNRTSYVMLAHTTKIEDMKDKQVWV